MIERQWQLSLEAEQNPQLQELHRLTQSIVDNQDTLAGEIQSTARGGAAWAHRDINDPESMMETVNDFLASSRVKTLTPEEHIRVTKALLLNDESEWGYGQILQSDSLFGDVEDVAMRIPGTSATPYIISGLVGNDLMGRSKKVDRLVTQLDRSPLDRMILIGGLAISTSTGEYLTESSISYTGESAHGLEPITRIGADLHGDFRMSRGARFVADAVDPLGNRWPFGPIIPEALIAMYHSTEPQMLSSMLFHYSKKIGIAAMNDMYSRILKRLESSGFEGNGRSMFGDYGQDSGQDEAYSLKTRLSNEHEDFSYFDSFIIRPGNFELAIQIRSSAEGIVFSYTGPDIEGAELVTIPDSEIEDFIVTLFSNGYGRTSPHALLKVLEVFKDPDETDFIDTETMLK